MVQGPAAAWMQVRLAPGLMHESGGLWCSQGARNSFSLRSEKKTGARHLETSCHIKSGLLSVCVI